MAEKGVEGPLTDAPATFVTPEMHAAEASIPEPPPDRLGVEAEALGGLRNG
jgi:hypothetical protein